MDQCKWGIIGSADKLKAFEDDLKHSKYKHILKAVVLDDDQQNAVQNIENYNVLNNLQSLIESNVDAIYIASSFNQHYSQVRQCLLKGKPVLCERPIAQSAEELTRLIHLSIHNHTFMMEAMWIRFLPSIKKMLSIISSGAIGDILSVKTSLSYKTSNTPYLQPGNRVLFELGIYPVFLCTLLLGRPEYVQATGNIKEGSDDFFSAFLSFENGQYGFIEVTELPRTNSLAVITGSKGVLQIKNPWGAKPEGIEVDFFDGTKVLHKSEWDGGGLQFELDEVFESLQEDAVESQLYCHNFSLDVMQTMDDIKEQLHLIK